MENVEAVCHREGTLDPSADTLVWIGKVRSAPLIALLAEAVAARTGRPTQTLLVTPDRVAHYYADAVVVVNAEAGRLEALEGGRHKVPVREPDFYAQVVESPTCRRLLEDLVARQGEVWANTFVSHPILSEGLPDGVRLIGPPADVALRLNHKPTALAFIRRLGLPVLPTEVAADLEAAALAAARWINKRGAAYVAGPTGTSGSQSCFACSEADIFEGLAGRDGPFLVQPYIEAVASPSVIGCVANPREVLVGPVADQVLEGPRWLGCHLPSELPEPLQAELRRLTARVGRAMAEEGYRGIFGCDWLVTPEERLWFVEVNARKVGSAVEVALACRWGSDGACNLAALEMAAVRDGTFGPLAGAARSLRTPPGVHFGVEFVKERRRVAVVHDLPAPPPEADLFAGQRPADGAVFDHPGAGVVLHKGFLARLVAVAESRGALVALLAEQRRYVEATVAKEAVRVG